MREFDLPGSLHRKVRNSLESGKNIQSKLLKLVRIQRRKGFFCKNYDYSISNSPSPSLQKRGNADGFKGFEFSLSTPGYKAPAL